MISSLELPSQNNVGVDKFLQFKVDESTFSRFQGKDDNNPESDPFLQVLKIQEGLEAIYIIYPDKISSELEIQSLNIHPPVACLLELRYSPISPAENGYYSLGVVWFQRGFSISLNEEKLKELSKIPFKKIATFTPWPF